MLGLVAQSLIWYRLRQIYLYEAHDLSVWWQPKASCRYAAAIVLPLFCQVLCGKHCRESVYIWQDQMLQITAHQGAEQAAETEHSS